MTGRRNRRIAVIPTEVRTLYYGFNDAEALYLQSRGRSTYHALQTSLTKRFSKGYQLHAAYTYSVAKDLMSADPGSTAGGGKPDVPNTGFIAQGFDLSSPFHRTPQSSDPRIAWAFEGIGKDIEWMSRIGIGGMQAFDGALLTPPIVPKRLSFMSPDWRDAFRHAAKLAEQKGLELETDVDPELPQSILTDGQRLQQVLRNLLSNAVKFTTSGMVTLEIRTATGERFTLFAEPSQEGSGELAIPGVRAGDAERGAWALAERARVVREWQCFLARVPLVLARSEGAPGEADFYRQALAAARAACSRSSNPRRSLSATAIAIFALFIFIGWLLAVLLSALLLVAFGTDQARRAAANIGGEHICNRQGRQCGHDQQALHVITRNTRGCDPARCALLLPTRRPAPTP